MDLVRACSNLDCGVSELVTSTCLGDMVVELNQSFGSPTSGRPLNSLLDSIPRVSPKANFRVSPSFP